MLQAWMDGGSVLGFVHEIKCKVLHAWTDNIRIVGILSKRLI